ncbi:hypothetical protein [Pyxidicoccus xibeiensis]|uniref:hypothetical protein n=1 Tax=Pyxidicoccus xibeiensis TaxID=2906759 RepID=UPI00225E6F63|nr:hypothetical protein [Pyxidicoccus xibeiensis]
MTPLPRRLLRAAHRAASLTSVRLALFAVLALVACWRPLTVAGGLNDFRDAHLLNAYEDAGSRTLTRYGQLPLWNPWSCGGQYALGSPQTRVAAPTLLLSAALGPRRAEPVALWAFLVLGMEGFFRYARRRVGSAVGALAAAPLFGLAGFTALSWSIGWLNFAGFLLLPWLMLGARRAAEGRVSGAVLVAGIFAFLLGFGGTYPVPMGALFVALESGRTLYRLRGPARLRALWALGATALFTLGACAFRLWPLVETMRSSPRVMAGTPGHSLETLAKMLLQLPARSGHSDPGNFYLVPVALALVPVAVALCRRRALYPTVLATLCVWMAAGYSVKPSLFAGLRLLPIFGTLRYPERFLVPAGLFIAELAALGLAALLVRSLRAPRHASRWWLSAVVVCGVMMAGWGVQAHAFRNLTRWAPMVAEPPPTPPESEQPFAQARGNRWAQGYFLALNRGSIACGEAWPVPMSERLRGDLPQEEYLEDASAGTARRVEWTPNRVAVDVAASRPTVLLVNQNWHPGWKSSVGEVVSRDGLLAVRVPEGAHQVVLSFLPRSGLGGALVSVLAWAGLAFVARRPRAREQRLGATALMVASVPVLVWAALLLAWQEPVARAEPRGPDGVRMLVASLPPEARPFGARFDVPVELVAAEVPAAPDAEGIVPVVLYWRVTGPVPRSAGIFVHIPGPDGKRKGADHAVVGGTFFFRDAPRDVLLRDAFAVSTKDWEAGEWKLLVGLWHAGGDGSRIGAFGTDGKPLHEARVEVGSFTVPPKTQSSGQP